MQIAQQAMGLGYISYSKSGSELVVHTILLEKGGGESEIRHEPNLIVRIISILQLHGRKDLEKVVAKQLSQLSENFPFKTVFG